MNMLKGMDKAQILNFFLFKRSLTIWFKDLTCLLLSFFYKIKTLWDELENLNLLPSWTCAANNSCTCELPKKCFKMQRNSRIISFLMKLDKKYSQVRSNMLMMAALPTSSQASSFLLQEEKHLDISTSVNETNKSLACKAENRK